MGKRIIVGDIKSRDIYVFKTPLEKFKIAIRIAEKDNFIVETNDAQFIETLEVLCGEENINIYLKLFGKCEEVSFLNAYEYLGDLYDILNELRFLDELNDDCWTKDDIINDGIKDYEDKYKKIMGLLEQ